MKKTLITLATAVLCLTSCQPKAELKPRIVVMTDIGPEAVEPDDMESAVRLMSYADRFEIEAIMTTIGWNCDPYPSEWAEYLTRVIDAYGKDVDKLKARSGQKRFRSLEKENGTQELGYWPSVDYIRSRAMMGSQKAGIGVIGEGNDSPGSDFLIKLADEDDPRPIWVCSWGGANTLAQAIWRVQQTRTPDEVRSFVRKFRVYTISDQDMVYARRFDRAYSSHQWMRMNFSEDLCLIWDEGAWQRQCDLGKENWELHQKNIQTKGALGSEYPNYLWGVEGDTPTFLNIMPNGLNDAEDPTQASWAGFHVRGICPDLKTEAWNSWQEPVRSISVAFKERFYPDELNDFMARMQWADEGKGNTNPHIRLTASVNDESPVKIDEGLAPVHITANPGSVVCLDATPSYDDEGDQLSFFWWQQEQAGTEIIGSYKDEGGDTRLILNGAQQILAIDFQHEPSISIKIPLNAAGQSLHLICEVHDDGAFNLVSYRRIIIDVQK